MRPHTLRSNILFAILPLVAAAITAIFWLQYGLAKAEILTAINKESRSLAERTAAHVDQLLDQRHSDLFTLSDTSLITDYYRNIDFQLSNEAESYRKELEKYLLSFSGRSRVYTELAYLDASGRAVCRIDRDKPAPQRAVAPPPYFAAVKALGRGAWWVSDVERRTDGVCLLRYARPIHDEAGAFKGCLVLTYDLEQIAAILRAVRVGKSGWTALETASGAELFSRAPKTRPENLLTARAAATTLPWSVEVSAPLDDFLGPLRTIRDTGAAIALTVILALAAIILWRVRAITRPVGALVEASRRIADGALDYRIAEPGTGELGTLAAAFNEMARSLESNLKLKGELQSQLIQAEKLSAVGQLISSVAHELNNPLGIVCNYAELWMKDLDCPAAMRRDLERLRANALRCRKVVQNLLFFVRKSRQEKSRMDLNEAVKSAAELLDYRLHKADQVEVARDLDAALPDVIGDFQQIVQVLVNLIANSCDAMDDSPPYPERKTIFLSTSATNGRARLVVADNGPGIAAGSRNRIFEPFFTTKEPGRGTGLGLSICKQIVEEHGGSISFSERSPRGTLFEILLPIPAPATLNALEAPRAPVEYPSAAGRRLLVADDEKDLAELVARALRDDGAEVFVAFSGKTAIELLKTNRFDLVISDFQMKSTNGDELYAELVRRNPTDASRILFITGDILNARVIRFLKHNGLPYLTKPFNMSDLVREARRMLAQSQAARNGTSVAT